MCAKLFTKPRPKMSRFADISRCPGIPEPLLATAMCKFGGDVDLASGADFVIVGNLSG
jgi:hypothetical protein